MHAINRVMMNNPEYRHALYESKLCCAVGVQCCAQHYERPAVAEMLVTIEAVMRKVITVDDGAVFQLQDNVAEQDPEVSEHDHGSRAEANDATTPEPNQGNMLQSAVLRSGVQAARETGAQDPRETDDDSVELGAREQRESESSLEVHRSRCCCIARSICMRHCVHADRRRKQYFFPMQF